MSYSRRRHLNVTLTFEEPQNVALRLGLTSEVFIHRRTQMKR